MHNWLVLLLTLATVTRSEHYHIVPVDSTDSCHDYRNGTCFTLEQLVQTDLLSGGDNLTLSFLPGDHICEMLYICNFPEVIIAGQSATIISGRVLLFNISTLSIKGLHFTGASDESSLGYMSISQEVFIIKCYMVDLKLLKMEACTLRVTRTVAVRIEQVLFVNNTVRALYVEADTVYIEKSGFLSNDGGGAVHIESNETVINNSRFNSNTATAATIGGAVVVVSTNVTISLCNFTNNSAESGGAMYIFGLNVSISFCNFMDNIAQFGGAISTLRSNLFIYNCLLLNNSAILDGGAINVWFGSVSISNSELAYNSAKRAGGVILVLNGDLLISNSDLTNNRAASGGAILVLTGTITVSKAMFKNNSADIGGVFFVADGTVIISDSVLTSNRAKQDGVIAVAISTYTSIFDNLEGQNSIYVVHSNLSFTGVNNVINNENPIFALSSRVEFNGPTTLSNNRGVQGGAIRAVQSQIYINAKGVVISNNTASFGGGVFLRESTLFVHYPIEISHNRAQSGGGIYAYSSEIEFNSKVTTGCLFNHRYILCTCSDIVSVVFVSIIDRNDAQNGGGIYAVASNIKAFSQAHVHIKSNSAKKSGGGIYLQQSSKIYILKRDVELELGKKLVVLEIQNNRAQYGGGIFVADSTESGVCTGEDVTTTGEVTQTECFIQTLNLYGFDINFIKILINLIRSVPSSSEEVKCLMSKSINYRNTFLTNNTATQSGADIYGGLLDRCTVDASAELSSSDNGFEYLNNTVRFSSIASKAVRVKLCSSTKHTISVKKGKKFTVSVMAVDQVGNPMNNATIRSSVITDSGVGRLKEGQAEQIVGNQCTELEYNVFSQDRSAQVELYAEGPCINLGISKQTLNIYFQKCECTIGLQPIQSSIECKCDCDPVLQQEYQITNCSEKKGTIKLESTSNVWIGVTNTTNGTGYVVSNCTFDYCVLKPVNISLSNPDQQCAYNRSGILCGECEEGLSLVLGTSQCKQCSNTYLLLLLPFTLAGIGLVAFILVFNITVATGTIHGLIFYTNILAANQSIFIPFHNALIVFISWVNLDLGIETCFYDGMNSQAKVLLQLVFPAYLFLLMFLIIILSKYFDSFSKLLSNRNPVAALGTLVLLSYSKLLRFIIAALHYRVLDYPSKSSDIVWLYDGNVQYFAPDHVPRFVFAAIILTAGILFTVLLFFGQWFPCCSKWKLMKWTKNVKYIGFMDAYHAPFTPKHRYWVGLLLFSFIAHNLLTALTPDTSLPVLSCEVLSVGLISWKLLNNRLYKNKFRDSLETLYLLNVAFLAFGTSYIKDTRKYQSALANTSMALSFILFAITLCYHFYQFVLKKSTTWLRIEDIVRNLGASVADRRANNGREMYEQVANENYDDELLEAVDNYEQRDPMDPPYTDGAVEEADPDSYIIIRSADQLREPALDVLAPLTTEDYRPAPPPPRVKCCTVVTHTEIGPIHYEV